MNAFRMARYLWRVALPFLERRGILLCVAMVPLVLTISHQEISSVVPFLTIILFLVAEFIGILPISVLDKAPQAYAFLPQHRRDVVAGVYLLFGLLAGIALAVSVLLMGIFGALGLLGADGFSFLLVSLLSVFVLCAYHAVIVPAVLRFGYAKTQPFIFVILFTVMFLGSFIVGGSSREAAAIRQAVLGVLQNPAAAVPVVLCAAALILWISYCIAQRIYARKDI